jgi:hypothetical protein
MKLDEIVLNKVTKPDGTISIPSRAIQIKPEFMKHLFTKLDGTNNLYHKGELVDQIASKWDDKLKGKAEIIITSAYIDRTTVLNVDTEKHIISEVSDAYLGLIEIGQVAFGRGIVKIEAKGFTNEYSPAIAIAISGTGDELAWGSIVDICSNFTIFRADNIRSTSHKVPAGGFTGGMTKESLSSIIKQFERFMDETESKFQEEQALIDELKNQPVTKSEFNSLIGDTFSKIQWVNHNRVQRTISNVKDKELAVNGLQLGRIAVEAYAPSYPVYNWDGDVTTRWNIVNYGTEVLKFEKGSDMVTVLRANSNWVNLVKNYNFHKN